MAPSPLALLKYASSAVTSVARFLQGDGVIERVKQMVVEGDGKLRSAPIDCPARYSRKASVRQQVQ